MKPHEERLVAEEKALGEKIERLNTFIHSEEFAELPLNERLLLKRQKDTMSAYRSILVERISLIQ